MKIEEFQNLFTNLTASQEDLFCYYDLGQHDRVSFNFLKAKIEVPDHTHQQTVINYVLSGKMEVRMGEERKRLSQGDWIKIPRDTLHSVKTNSEVSLIEFWLAEGARP